MRDIYSVFIILLITAVTISCSKDDEEDNAPAPTKKDRLVGNNWQLSAYTIEPAIDFDGNGTQENNLIPFFQACTLDDIIDFNSDDSYTVEEGDTKCDPNAPQVSETGTWSFNTDQTVLLMDPSDSDSYEFMIESISATTLVLNRQEVINGVTYTSTLTLD